MPTSRHDAVIAIILAQHPAARRLKMMKTIRAAVGQDLAVDFTDYLMVPDAYIVDAENKLVVAFEVVITHPVSGEKMELYTDLWWGLDGHEWDFLLVMVDWWGNQTPIDMGDFAVLCSMRHQPAAGRRGAGAASFASPDSYVMLPTKARWGAPVCPMPMGLL